MEKLWIHKMGKVLDNNFDLYWELFRLVLIGGQVVYSCYVIFTFYAKRLAEINGSLVFRDLSVSSEISEIFFAALV